MSRQYFTQNIMNQKVIWYEENGIRISFFENQNHYEVDNYLKWVAEGNVAEEVND